MRRKPFFKFLGLIASVLCAFNPVSVLACATCFGKSDSAMAKGMNMGILTLLIVVLFMWAAFTAFFVFLAKKSSSTPISAEGSRDLAQPATLSK